jgi:glyoxylase-like metal-dependent hydrolase (beta-lactamase superfamily II)
MTLEGTNTWVLAAPGGGASVIVDCGPDNSEHLAAVIAAARSDGREIGKVLVTHHHLDHAQGLETLTAMTGIDLTPVADGDVVRVDGLQLDVLGTPGHSSDSVTFFDRDEGCLYTGDTVLGRGTTVVAHPDGRLADYLASLERLAGTPAERIRPGHGPDVTDVAGWIGYYRSHRAERLQQVRDAVWAGAHTPQAVVEQVYADVDSRLAGAVRLSVAAQLEYLRERGDLPVQMTMSA